MIKQDAHHLFIAFGKHENFLENKLIQSRGNIEKKQV